jgi:hypothetical protein
MSKPIVRRLIVVLALSAFLGSPATSLAGPRSSAAAARHARAQAAPQGLLSRAWNSLVRIWEKEGCRIDPNGQCVPIPQASADNGCGLDPYGQCTPSH